MDSKMYEKAVTATRNKVKIHNLINFDVEPIEPVKVSVVVPVCNVETYLRECLDSAVNQTLKEIEIICVNDGSTDGSLAILMEYAAKDRRVKIIDKDNAGYGHAMNIGMDMASGQYIAILESDDYVDLHMYEDLYKVAINNKLEFVKSDFYRFYGVGETLKTEYNKIARDDINYNILINPSEQQIAFTFIMNTWSGIYNRAFLKKNCIRHHETPGASFQDNGFWFKCNMYATRTMYLNHAYYMNRRDNPNSSVYNPNKVYCANTEYDLIYQHLKNTDSLNKFIEVYTTKKYHTYIFTLNRIAPKFRKEYLEHIAVEFREMKQRGELISRYLSNNDWNNLRWIMRDPDEYYYVALGNDIKISVILPVYNVAPYLDQCLDSIESQTLQSIEIICIDDGSTDMSLEILQRHQGQDHRIKIITQENVGAGAARNVGLAMAKGKYLSFLDADDFIDKDTFKLAYDMAEARNADITIYKSFLYDNRTGSEQKNTYSVRNERLPKSATFSRVQISSNIFTSIMGWAWDKLYKRTFVLNSGLLFQEQRTTNDMYFVYASLLKAPRITILDKYLYHQRRNVSTSLSNSRELSWPCFYHALKKLQDELKKDGIYEEYERDFINYALHSCLWNFNSLREPVAESLFKQLRESWFDELGITAHDADYFDNQAEYYQYKEMIQVPHDAGAYSDYRINSLLSKLATAEKKAGTTLVKVSDKETLTMDQLVEKLTWNRKQVSKLKSQVKQRENEICEIRNSFTYKIGRVITYLPRLLRHVFTKAPM